MNNDHLDWQASYLLDLDLGKRESLMPPIATQPLPPMACKSDGMRSRRLQRIVDRFRRRLPNSFRHLHSMADYKGQSSVIWNSEPPDEAFGLIQQAW